MRAFISEDDIEQQLLGVFEEMGYACVFGPEIAPPPDGEHPERENYLQVVLTDRLRGALRRINPQLPADAIEYVVRIVQSLDNPALIAANRDFHKLLLEGVPVEYQDPKKGTVHDHAKLIDFDSAGNNEFLAVNQFTVIEKQNRRPDIVVFINGLPLGVIELKSPSSEEAEVKGAFNQLQTYKEYIPTLFRTNQVLAVSDGWNARVGTLTADWEWFMPWRMIDGSEVEPPTVPQSEVLVRGLFEPARLLDYIRSFIVFEDDGAKITKKAAGYHQYHAVNKAVQKTIEASQPKGNRKIGVVWHTQGSGKSLSMAFFAGKIIQHPQMANPTLVVITDRNDLDDQLFGQFSRAKGLLRQTPEQADNRGHLRELLTRAAGGVVFTTIQKFLPAPGDDTVPKLSDRRNIVVIADEAHRSQYGFIAGFARHMRDALPNASFIGFTGTPIESDDRSTPAVFGDYIDVYDIQRAVEDKATVPIYYEGRLARLKLRTEQIPRIDEEVEEVSEGQEEELAGR